MMRHLFTISIVLVLGACLKSPAQQIEIAVQKGHSSDIRFVTFNSDGRLIASSGADNLIKLWHVPTGREMASFISASAESVQSMAFSQQDDFLYVLYVDGTVHTWDIARSVLKSMEKPPGEILFPKQKQFTARDGATTFTIDRFYLKKNATSGKSFSKVPIDISANFTSIAVTEKFQKVMAANEDGRIYVYDFNKGKSLATLDAHLADVNSVCMAPGEEIFASASSDRSIILWDTRTLKIVKRLFGRSFRFESLAFDHTGTLLAAGDELGTGRIVNLQSSRIRVSSYKWHNQPVTDIKFSSNDSLIYSGGMDNRLEVFNLRREKLEKHYTYRNYVSLGDMFLKKLGAYREPYAWVNTVAISPNNQFVASAGAWRESVVRKQAQPIVFNNLAEHRIRKIKAHQGSVNSLLFINDLTFLSGHRDKLIQWYHDSGKQRFYFHENTLAGADIQSILPYAQDTVVINGGKSISWFDLKQDKVVRTIDVGKPIIAMGVDRNTGLVAYSTFNELVIRNPDRPGDGDIVINKAHTDRITAMAFSPTRSLLATASWDATIKLWDPKTGALLVTIVPMGKDDHIVITPDNYYFGTRNSMKGIGFKFGKEFVSPEQYDLRFNRPDIVLERMGFAPPHVVKSYRRAYLKRLQRMNFTEQMLSEEIHQPQIEISSKDLALSTHEKSLQFEVTALDTKYNLDRVNVYVNNIPVFGLMGIDLRDRKKGEIKVPVSIELSAGVNKVQLSCLNEKGVESLLETFEIRSAHEDRKPDLYLAVISVSSYQNTSKNLKYATKDGRDLASLFARKSGDYGHVYVDSLLNRNATKEKILALKEKLAKSGVDDEVIVYVSGHGLLDDNLDFYFATYDLDFAHPALRGLKYDDLEGLLDGIPSRQKLLLMDACHSGEVDKSTIQVNADQQVQLSSNQKGSVKTYSYAQETTEENYKVGITTSFELMQELFTNVTKGSGAVVISAAAGNSYALESDEWRNGVFTYALMTGLKNGLADANKDHVITVTEIRNYVGTEVERLTKGQQKPTSRRENLEFDFKVW